MSSGLSVPVTLVGKALQPIRIVLVDDHAILRESLKALIEIQKDFTVIGEFGGVDAALAIIGNLQPDVVVTDLALPGRSGIELIGEISRLAPLTRMLVLTAHDNEEYIRAAMNAGANGYVLKHAKGTELIQAIRTVAGGEQFLCASIGNAVIRGYLNGGKRPAASIEGQALTPREREVLTGIASGNPTKQIARELGLSPKTVEKHRSNLMRKLQLHNMAAVTTYAVRHGMVGGEGASGNAPVDSRILGRG